MSAEGQEPGERDLDVVQRWFQWVISHPHGIDGGVESDEARALIPIDRSELEKIVSRSSRLSARERIGVYANAYYARLVECLAESFPALEHAVGSETFRKFAFAYLQEFPSRSYTLNDLAVSFPLHLERTRPPRESAGDPDWADFLIDVARLELAIAAVFDGPGTERTGALTSADLEALGPERWATSRLIPAPCLTLLEFTYPVNAYYTAFKNRSEGERRSIEIPAARSEFVAIHRRQFRVRRHTLNFEQHALLAALIDGLPVAAAIERAARETDSEDEQLSRVIGLWFRAWCADGFFASIHD